jgi:hypothetical protein
MGREAAEPTRPGRLMIILPHGSKLPMAVLFPWDVNGRSLCMGGPNRRDPRRPRWVDSRPSAFPPLSRLLTHNGSRSARIYDAAARLYG